MLGIIIRVTRAAGDFGWRWRYPLGLLAVLGAAYDIMLIARF